MNAMLHHNEKERNSPDLPSYLLDKVKQMSQEIDLASSKVLPTPEPHCNCPFCQIAKSIQETAQCKQREALAQEEEEEISEKDLSFHSWIIHPIEKNLYAVSHPDNPEEEYQVFLDSPIGCTCGSNQCEHIHAVLRS